VRKISTAFHQFEHIKLHLINRIGPLIFQILRFHGVLEQKRSAVGSKTDGDLPVSEESIASTNLDALAGYCITEAVRWGNSEWELFSGGGDEVAESEARKIPLATLFAFDSSLQPVTELQVGEGGWREDIGSELQRWIHGES
tara:strand:- start:101 stop:526 length:426 start_codon:yes stop_codon:yes gene_type:complete